MSPFFHDVADVGDSIELRGPLRGHFVWSVTDGGPLLLVGASSGVVPLMAMIRHRQAAAQVPTLLLLSSRDWNEILYRDELIHTDTRSAGFTLVLTLTREHARRPGDYDRRVDVAMMREASARLPAAPRYVFICGSNPFVNAAADGALVAGLPASIVRTERYGG